MRVVNWSMIALIYLIIMIIAAVFVYRDAKKRNMNAVAWAMVAFFGPFLLGLLTYLICRNPLIDLQCPRCGASLSASETSCPQCHSPLLTQCPQCTFPVQKGWKSCPQCGTEFAGNYEQPIRVRRKETGIGAIVAIVVVLVTGLLLITGLTMMMNNVSTSESHSYSGFEGMYNIAKEDLVGNETIASWIASADESKKDMHVLLSKSSKTCLIYIKNNENLMNIESEIEYRGEVCNLNFYINEDGYEDKYGYHFFLYEIEIYDETNVTAYFNGDKSSVELTFTDSDINRDTWRANQ